MTSSPEVGHIGSTPFSDTVAGRVVDHDPDHGSFRMESLGGETVAVRLTATTSAEIVANLGDPFLDATSQMPMMLGLGRFLFVYGIVYPDPAGHVYEAKRIIFLGKDIGEYVFEGQTWWVDQIDALASFYRRAQFGRGPVDYRDYRTILRLGGDKTDSHVQETDTISRLVYGMASAYMLTGNEDYLDVAEVGTEYLRDHMRFVDRDEDVVYWYHGILVEGERETKIFTSEFADDYDAIPMYEQIYALAGLTQTYRVTGDPRIMDDIQGTMRLFDRFFLDRQHGGYFSHIDPIRMSALDPSLGPNVARKNWNSIGDHAPAYLINLYLATREERYAAMLEDSFDTIVQRFPDYERSPFVQERFHRDWSADTSYEWQQDRAVVGHNLKIAWNLMRMWSLRPKGEYLDLAQHIAKLMPDVGSDRQRGGWYDVMERQVAQGEMHRFAWHDRKAWWQQEQAILAYLILAGTTEEDEYRRHAQEASAFYNAFFLDHDEGAVYFNVFASGIPCLNGTERLKGSHSMSMYHSAELCYLATVYQQLLIRRQPLDLWFRPLPSGFARRTLRVVPDLLPAGSVRIGEVAVDGEPYSRFDPDALEVSLPESSERVTVRVQLVPAAEMRE